MARLPDVQFRLLAKPDDVDALQWPSIDNYRVIGCDAPPLSIKEQWQFLPCVPPETDLLWMTHFNVPLAARRKMLVTVHDYFPIGLPQYSSLPQRLYVHAVAAKIKRAARVICVSQFTRDEMIRLSGIDPRRLEIIHEGVDNCWFDIPQGPSPHERPYLLFVGIVKEYKNLRRLIEAMELLKVRIPHDLVVVGPRAGLKSKDNRVFEMAETLEGRVRFTDRVPFDQLQQFYRHADLFVFPSLYEGFGLPPLEAMAAGCPVAASNRSSIPEVCGDAAVYFDPYDVADMAETIVKALQDDGLKAELRRKGETRSRMFDWDRCAARTAQTIREQIGV